MTSKTGVTAETVQCVSCGFKAASDDEAWKRIDHPPLGSMTQCPECGSTNTHTV